MKILVFLLKSGMDFEEVKKTSEKRVDSYQKVKGLLQKYYVMDKSSNHIGGIFLFDSQKNLEAFRESDLAKSTSEAYKFLEPPEVRILDVAKILHEKFIPEVVAHTVAESTA